MILGERIEHFSYFFYFVINDSSSRRLPSLGHITSPFPHFLDFSHRQNGPSFSAPKSFGELITWQIFNYQKNVRIFFVAPNIPENNFFRTSYRKLEKNVLFIFSCSSQPWLWMKKLSQKVPSKVMVGSKQTDNGDFFDIKISFNIFNFFTKWRHE